MAAWFNQANKVVFSHTLEKVTWKNTLLRRELYPGAVAAMKREPGKDMMIFGSGTVASQLAEHGLIDEYQFVVTPLFLGDGRTLINGVEKRVALKLIEVKAYRSGNVKLRYEPAT